MNTCPICGNGLARELFRFETLAFIPGRVVRCLNCETVYKIPLDLERPLSSYYDDCYAGHEYWEQEEAAVPTFRKILGIIAAQAGDVGRKLLDVGCGPGTFLSVAQEAGFSVTGVELNPTLAAKARSRTNAEVVAGEFMSAELNGRQFGVITILDLIEHLPDPVAALDRCRALLEPGGCVALYTPNHGGLIVRVARACYRVSPKRFGRPVAEIFDCSHVVFFDKRSLKAAVTRAGLEVVHTALLKYDPSRSNQARGIEVLALKAIEAVSVPMRGQFRMLMIARKPVG
jgi:2-polyprenyl-3-methyl-5-hydroxy-6-metoxy-1,4-benzoquinol methylase